MKKVMKDFGPINELRQFIRHRNAEKRQNYIWSCCHKSINQYDKLKRFCNVLQKIVQNLTYEKNAALHNAKY